MELLTFLNGLPTPTASFLGAMAGGGIGLVAVVAGALVNAQLNRNRDGRLRALERRSVATAFQAELMMFRDSLYRNASSAEENLDDESDMTGADPIQLVSVRTSLGDKMSLLSSEAVRSIVNAYGVLPNYVDRLISQGAQMLPPRSAHDDRRLILVPHNRRRHYAAISRSTAVLFDEAIVSLDKEIRR